MQWTMPQGFFGPLRDDRPGRQRVPAALRRDPEALGRGRGRGPQERLPHPVVGTGTTSRSTVDDYLDVAADHRPDLPLRLRHARRRRRRLRAHHRRAGRRPPAPAGLRRRLRQRRPTRHRLPLHWPLDDIYEIGADTAGRLWERAGVGPADVDLPQLYDGFSPFVWFWLEVLGLCPVGEAHRFVADGGIDSDVPGALPALSGGGALGNGRMHGVPQMLECYLQLSGGPATASATDATIGRRVPLLAALRWRGRVQRRASVS